MASLLDTRHETDRLRDAEGKGLTTAMRASLSAVTFSETSPSLAFTFARVMLTWMNANPVGGRSSSAGILHTLSDVIVQVPARERTFGSDSPALLASQSVLHALHTVLFSTVHGDDANESLKQDMHRPHALSDVAVDETVWYERPEVHDVIAWHFRVLLRK